MQDYKWDVSAGGRRFSRGRQRQANSTNGRHMDHPLGLCLLMLCKGKEIKDRAALSSPQAAEEEE